MERTGEYADAMLQCATFLEYEADRAVVQSRRAAVNLQRIDQTMRATTVKLTKDLQMCRVAAASLEAVIAAMEKEAGIAQTGAAPEGASTA